MNRFVPQDRLTSLPAPEQGLSAAEAASRREQYGLNIIVETVGASWSSVAHATLKDPMLWFLLATSVLFGVVGEYTEAAILLVALIPFFGMDAFLHRRTQASIAGLSSRLAVEATVVRDGQPQTVPVSEVVPGDLVMLETGQFFPGDGVILEADRLQVDESALTGEAFPVRKRPLDNVAQLKSGGRIDGVHWGLAGTRVLTGTARMTVLFTGRETVYGEIARSAILGSHERTPLQRAVAELVKVLIVAASVICIALAWVRLRQGHGLVDAVLSALTLAVAALPEEFPVVLTFFLGVGVYRLAKRQALVRRGVVVENIGRVSAICSDKTGTITEGRLHLTHLLAAPEVSEQRLLALAAVASRHETNDPIDSAILAAAPAMAAFSELTCFPFTEDRKRETGVVHKGETLMAATKGAPEAILNLCALSGPEANNWAARTQEFAASGHKVIACAWRELDPQKWAGGEPDRGFRLAGLIAFEDPVRDGVPEALQRCQRANIHVIMVTGDHPATATAVARDIGLGKGAPRVIEGDEMMARIEQEGGTFLHDVDVIARAVPAQKLGLVRALQAEREIVAVTGDGVNDVPALQAADIGIAMGERGTRSAREVSAIVLLDDNFRSIVQAIAEGRQLFRNLQLSFQYLLMIHLPLVITAAVIPLVGYPLLYLPIHIVWLEMIIHPTALLVFQDLPPDDHLVRRKHEPRLRFFDRWQWLSIVLVGTTILVVVTASYVRSLGAGYEVEHARAMALVALTVASAGITASLSKLRSLTAKLIVGLTILVSVVLVQVPGLAALLHLKPLHFDDWAIAVAGGLLAAVIPAVQRQFENRHLPRHRAHP